MADHSSIEWTGRRLGVLKTAARRVGLPLAEYSARVANGEKWCTGCKAWHPATDFPVDRSRGDGRRAKCLAAERGKPRIARDPAHEAARRAVAYAIKTGRLEHPNSLPCADCGHLGAGGHRSRRHEYDHFLGYAPEHRLDVQPVCTLCHADRERARRVHV